MIGIHPDLNFSYTPFVKRYMKILEHNGVQYEKLSIQDTDFWEKLSTLKYFIFRYNLNQTTMQLARDIMPIAEQTYGVNTFPDQNTCWHYDNKIRQYFMMQSRDCSMTESYVFYDKEHAMEWLRGFSSFPIVFKSKRGAGSSNVVLVHNKEKAEKIIIKAFGPFGVGPRSFIKPGDLSWLSRRKLKLRNYLESKGVGFDFDNYLKRWEMDKNYVLFQKFLPNNGYDTRITVIGGRAFGFVRQNRKDDFRSSGSGFIDHDPSKIDLKHVKNALEVSQKFGFQSMAYDMLYNEQGDSEFCEISYTYLDKPVQMCPGYWDKDLNWVEGHNWPQYFHLMDFLDRPDLLQPDLQEV